APVHLQRVLLPGERHAVDAAVARRAAHTLVHVDAVIEVDEFRKVVHPRPRERPAGLEALAHGLEHRALGPDLRMAVHAGLGRRDPGEGRGFDRGVAVTAIEAFAAHVVLVAEGDRLLARGVRQGQVRGAAHDVDQPAQPRDEEHRSEDAHPRDGIRAAMEYLRHSARLYPSTGSLLADAKDGALLRSERACKARTARGDSCAGFWN